MNKTTAKCSCTTCKKEYSIKGIFTHYIIAHTSDGKLKHLDRSSKALKIAKDSNALQYQQIQNDYIKSPNICKQCNSVLPYNIKNNKFCSHSCAAKFNNKFQKPKSIETRLKISKALTISKSGNSPIVTKIKYCKSCKKYHIRGTVCNKTRLTKNPEILGDYSKVYYCKCKICSAQYTNSTPTILCNTCVRLTEAFRARYRFTFNVYHYPELFDIGTLNQIGWYSPGGRAGKWNLNGLSRDHKVSVAEAIKNNYDPFYISHVLNCQLIPHTDNNKKNINSCLSYTELVSMVDHYEKHIVELVGLEPTKA